MKLIKPSFEILDFPTEVSEESIFKIIEIAGRTCYKSEDRITEDSAKKFVQMLINSGHGAMLEHGTVYLKVPYDYIKTTQHSYDIEEFYAMNPYSVINAPFNLKEDMGEYTLDNNAYYITTNYRVLIENNRLEDLKFLSAPTGFHEKRISVRFIMDRIGSQSFTRHRVFSFAQESTRYCNYSSNKFNNEVTFIIPSWAKSLQPGVLEYTIFEITSREVTFMDSCYKSEANYLDMLNDGCTPQEARQVLPNALKTELVMTGTLQQWKGFFKLRCASNAHPDARYLALGLQNEFVKRNYMDKAEVIN